MLTPFLLGFEVKIQDYAEGVDQFQPRVTPWDRDINFFGANPERVRWLHLKTAFVEMCPGPVETLSGFRLI